MSYESELQERTNIFQPMPLALLASVILHLLVYKFGLPNFSLSENPTKREVSIVELTPEQQARLPQLYSEPNIPDIPQLENPLTENTPAPPFALPPSLTPGIGDFPNLPPIAIPLPPEFDIPPLPPLPNTNIELPPIGDLSTLPPPPSIESFELPTESQTKTPPATSGKPSPPPESKPEPIAPPPEDKSEPEPKPEEPKSSPQKIAAQRQQNLQQEVSSLSSSLQKKNTATTDEEARKNYVAWLNRVKAIAPENLDVAGTYPRDACIRKLEGTSVFGVVVNAKGEIVASDLLKGAKYPVFDLQGSKDLAKLKFENDTKQPKPYRVTLNYKYDSEICPSLTLPSLRRDNKINTPQSETQPTPNKTEQQSPQPEAETPETPAQAGEQPPQPEAETPESEAETEEQSPQPEAETPETSSAAEEAQSPSPEAETPNKPSLRDRLQNIPLLPEDRFSSPAENSKQPKSETTAPETSK